MSNFYVYNGEDGDIISDGKGFYAYKSGDMWDWESFSSLKSARDFLQSDLTKDFIVVG